MTIKYTFEQLGYSDLELRDLILSLKTGSTKMKDGEMKQVRYKLCYNTDDESSVSAIKINGGLKDIAEFSEFLTMHKQGMVNLGKKQLD
jgi:hypothetical protein